MIKSCIFLALLIINGVIIAQTNLIRTSNQKIVNVINTLQSKGTKAVIDTLHYDGNNFDGIGTGGAGAFEVYAFFSAAQLSTYNAAGNTITSVDVFIKGISTVASTTIKFRPNQTTTVYSQPFTAIEGWNNVVLTTPFAIPATDLYIGYECVAIAGGYPLGCDAGPVNTNGNWIVYGGSWGHLTDLNAAMTYNWNIRARVNGAAAPSNDAKLSALNVNGSIVAGFSPTTYTYNVVLPYGSALPVVTATTNHASATKVITNASSLPGAATVVVTAQDGTTTQTYTINFTVAAPSSDAKLLSLLINGVSVPGFSPTVYSYNIVYPFGTTALPIVTATTNQANATKVITNITAFPGAATVLVTAQDGTTTLTYTINFSIAAPSTDAKLFDLLVNGTTVAGFSPNTYSYNVVYPFGTTTLPVVTAITNFVGATKVISNITAFPGAATVVVTAQDGTTILTYTINFSIAAPSTDAKLSDLLVNGTTVSGFSSTVYSYNIVYPYGTTALPVVTATTNFAGATKVITNITSFPGTATVVVTAQDGTTTITYTINFSVAAPSIDATLSDLLVNGTTVVGFSPTLYSYNVILPYGTTVMPVVTANLNDINASKVINNVTALPGAATVIVTAQDGITLSTYTINFTIALSINAVNVNYEIGYPSPTTGRIVIPCDNSGEVIISDMLGKVILKSVISPNNNEFNLAGNSKGTYLVQINIQGKNSSYKIVLE